MLRVLLLTLATALLCGCTSQFIYPDIAVPSEATSKLNGLVLGVEPAQEDGKAPYDVQTFIEALNEHHVFKQAAFLDRLDTKPDLVLRNYRSMPARWLGYHGETGGFLCIGYNQLIAFASLTVIPIYCNVEARTSFTLSASGSNPQRAFQFPAYSKQLMGIWAPVAAATNASWRSTSLNSEKNKDVEAERARRYKKYLVTKMRELEPSILEAAAGSP